MRVYRMAELNIGVESLHERVHGRCAAYATQAAPDFVIRISPEDIEWERTRLARNHPGQTWAEEQLEELAVYRRMAERLPAYDTLLVHGSAVAVNGRGYLFLAPSGTGKSTHARLWKTLLGDRLAYVNDDKPLLRLTPEGTMLCGTPFDGKHHLSANVAVPLQAACFLRRGTENRIRRIDGRTAFVGLLQQVYRPRDRAALQRTISLLQTLTERAPFYALACTMDLEAARVAYAAMTPAKE